MIIITEIALLCNLIISSTAYMYTIRKSNQTKKEIKILVQTIDCKIDELDRKHKRNEKFINEMLFRLDNIAHDLHALQALQKMDSTDQKEDMKIVEEYVKSIFDQQHKLQELHTIDSADQQAEMEIVEQDVKELFTQQHKLKEEIDSLKQQTND